MKVKHAVQLDSADLNILGISSTDKLCSKSNTSDRTMPYM